MEYGFVADTDFGDVDNHWARIYIYMAHKFFNTENKNGVVYFHPDEKALREDIVTAIVKAAGLKDAEYDLTVLDKFSDKDQISESLKKYIAIALKYGIANGNADGTFNPKGELTRAEVAQLFYNVTNKLGDKLDDRDDITIDKNDNIIDLGSYYNYCYYTYNDEKCYAVSRYIYDAKVTDKSLRDDVTQNGKHYSQLYSFSDYEEELKITVKRISDDKILKEFTIENPVLISGEIIKKDEVEDKLKITISVQQGVVPESIDVYDYTHNMFISYDDFEITDSKYEERTNFSVYVIYPQDYWKIKNFCYNFWVRVKLSGYVYKNLKIELAEGISKYYSKCKGTILKIEYDSTKDITTLYISDPDLKYYYSGNLENVNVDDYIEYYAEDCSDSTEFNIANNIEVISTKDERTPKYDSEKLSIDLGVNWETVRFDPNNCNILYRSSQRYICDGSIVNTEKIKDQDNFIINWYEYDENDEFISLPVIKENKVENPALVTTKKVGSSLKIYIKSPNIIKDVSVKDGYIGNVPTYAPLKLTKNGEQYNVVLNNYKNYGNYYVNIYITFENGIMISRKAKI